MVTNSGDLVGRVLGGCKLERLIGQGGMSAVYLAQQAQPERNVAVKVLMPHLDVSSEDYVTFLARFRREANIVAKLEHINIVPLYAYGEEQQHAYLVMPYVNGGSLSDVMAVKGKLSLQQTFHYLQQAAAALDYAHARNVVHRDLKPGNFLLYPSDNRLVLADFGVARITDENPFGAYEAVLTQTGVMPGTLAYMAPEMLQDARSVDHRVDIYALGIVLYQLLSGQLPFKGDLFALINKQMEEALPPLHQQDPSIPASIDSVLRKATAKRRQDRYISAGQFASDFFIAMGGNPAQPSMSGLNENINAVELTNGGRRMIDTPPKGPFFIDTSSVNTLIIDKKVITPPPLRSNGYEGIIADGVSLPSTGPNSRSFQSRKRPHNIWLLLVVSLIIVGGGAGGIWMFYHSHASAVGSQQTQKAQQPTLTLQPTPTPQPAPTPQPTPIPLPTQQTILQAPQPLPVQQLSPAQQAQQMQQAQQLIQQFYSDLNNHDDQSAYSLFAPAFQSRISYDVFASNYVNLVQISVSIDSTSVNAANDIIVEVTIQAVRTRPNGDVNTTAHAWFRVVRLNGVWKIMNIRRQVGVATSVG
jgi:serine/threonine-protein kinase